MVLSLFMFLFLVENANNKAGKFRNKMIIRLCLSDKFEMTSKGKNGDSFFNITSKCANTTSATSAVLCGYLMMTEVKNVWVSSYC